MNEGSRIVDISSSTKLLAGVAFLATTLAVIAIQSSSSKKQTVVKESHGGDAPTSANEISNETRRKVHILYGTTTGTSRTFSQTLSRHIEKKCNLNVLVTDLKDYNEELLSKEDIVLIICSTWTDGKPPQSCQRFFDGVQDLAFDFRVSKDSLSAIEFSVFGLGGELYGNNFCKAVRTF